VESQLKLKQNTWRTSAALAVMGLTLIIGIASAAPTAHIKHRATEPKARHTDVHTTDAWIPRLALRTVPLPAALPQYGITHPIDRLLRTYYHAHSVTANPLVDDRTYARRVYLDIIGLLPTPVELQTFLSDKRADKRALLADQLLADNRRYSEHWITFWNDMLRNDYAGTGYIDGGRTQITDWLLNALTTNMPYDRFVAQLVNPTPESAGFVNGIVWRGVVNSSQTPPMQAAQSISQVFMGINLKCASCHNSFISSWKLADAYGMASIYSDKPLELVRCDKPQGQTAAIKFLYPELGKIDAGADKTTRQAELASIMTCRANGRLARTFVNRMWARLMGRGLVEPTDEMDHEPWDPDLLDWLSTDFVDHGYDVKRLIKRIVTSRAYQASAMSLKSERTPEFVFSGPVVKRMDAEQFVDAVSSLTGVWQRPARQFPIMNGKITLPADKSATIKFESGLMRSGSVDIDVDVTGAQTLSLVVTDAGDGGELDWADWINPRLVGPGGETPLTSLKWKDGSTGYGSIQIDKSVVEKPLRLGDQTYPHGIGTHANSVITYLLPPGTTRFRATAGPDQGAVEQKNSKTSIQFYVVTGDLSVLEARASMALADPLMRALDRPNREQVVTERSTVATTLQGLELTNGSTLNDMIAQGAQRWSQEAHTPAELVDGLYLRALGRHPTPVERQAAIGLVGTPVQPNGVEDLLWAMVMLPEFQLVY
jgi:hypothetical protein